MPTNRLTREQAFELLSYAGFPQAKVTTNAGFEVPLHVVLVAIGEAESDLFVDAESVPNRDGSIDRGWLQINSIHNYDAARLLTDAHYTADCAYQLFAQRGLRPWAAYGKEWPEETPRFRYLRRMPPCYGGKTLTQGMSNLLIRSMQAFLNRRIAAGLLKKADGSAFTPLVEDGAWGPRTQAVLMEWKRRSHNDGRQDVDGRCWTKMESQGLR